MVNIFTKLTMITEVLLSLNSIQFVLTEKSSTIRIQTLYCGIVGVDRSTELWCPYNEMTRTLDYSVQIECHWPQCRGAL